MIARVKNHGSGAFRNAFKAAAPGLSFGSTQVPLINFSVFSWWKTIFSYPARSGRKLNARAADSRNSVVVNLAASSLPRGRKLWTERGAVIDANSTTAET